VVLLPEGSTEGYLSEIAHQIHSAARDEGVTILGGHTEVTPGLQRPIVIVTVFSVVDRFVTSGDAKEGDTIMMTKTAGLEGTSELAAECDFPDKTVAPSVLRKALRLIDHLDITKEAVTAFRTGRVHAMHDCTEGGVVGGVFEMSMASRLGFRIDELAIPVAKETRTICDALSLDPIRLIGSGSLLIAVERGGEADVERALRPICPVTSIGVFKRRGRMLAKKDGMPEPLADAPQDELWRVVGLPSRRRHGL